MTTVLVTSQEKVPIYPLLADTPITPDEAAVVRVTTDINTLTDADFDKLTTLNSAPAVWVRGFTAGGYKVVCRMDQQSDDQRPVWELTGTIVVQNRV